MTAISITPGYPNYSDTDGSALNDGYVYIGLEYQNPITAPTGAFWDQDFQIPADQPLRTSGGYIVRDGSPAAVYTGAAYSILVQNKNLVTVYNAPSAVITNVTNTVEDITQYQGAHATDPLARNDGTPLQVGDLYFNTSINELKVWSGTTWVPSSPGNVAVQNFTGTGSQTAFTLSAAPIAENNTQIYIDGVYQQKDTYAVAGATINFSAAPPNLSTIEVVSFSIASLGTVDSSNVSYNQGGTGAVNQSVQSKLQESVSVKDFGATGDGVTDDTAAIQAALDAASVVVIPNATYICHGLTCAGKTIISENSTLKQKTGNENEAVLTFTGSSRLEGHLNVDLNTGIRAEDVVILNGTHTYVESIYIFNGTNDSGGYYAFSILAGDVVAGSIRTNAAGYAGVSVDSSANIDRIAIDYIESIDFFYKGFRCNGDVEEIIIDKMVAKTSFTNTGEDGFLVDTGVSGNEVQSLSIGSYISDGATANNMKLAEGTKDVNIGSVFINNAQAPTETYAFNILQGGNISINNITVNNATAGYLLNIRSLVRNFNCNSFYTNSAADTYVVRVEGGASGVMNMNFGSIVIDNNTKTNGFFRLEGFSGQELYCDIGMFYTDADQRPLNIQALPANAGAVTIQNMIGYTGTNWTGVSANNIVLNLPKPRKQLYLTAIPTTGTFVTGDIIFDSTPVAGGHIGWVCTTAGTPGTWKTFGAITL